MTDVVRIDLAYDGGAFHGWQVQPGLRTVQGVLGAEISRLLGREAVPTGAGRTDAGVHALGQTASVDGLAPDEVARLVRVLPRRGPDDLEIRRVTPAPPGFNARFSALWRRYEYRLAWRRDLFRRGLEWQLDGEPDLDAMAAAAVHLRGRHDWRSFCKTSSWKDDNACDVAVAEFASHPGGAVFHVRADRFLHHMVRTMVGTLVEVGRGRRRPDDIPGIIAARDRGAAGTMAPPQGLYLAEVGYPEAPGPAAAPTEETA